MRTLIVLVMIVSVSALKAQTVLSPNFIDYIHRATFANNIHFADSISKKKWSFSKYSGISTSFAFFKGGNATIFSAPVGLQLNRRLNNNLYAFAGVSVAPAYVNFNRAFMTTDFNKVNQNATFFNSRSLSIYSRAEMGLQYVNDAKTFSISGSISVERSNYPILPYYQYNNYNTRQNPANFLNR